MEQNEFTYTRKIGRKTYQVIVRQSENARETVSNKLKRLLLNNLYEV